MLTTAKGWAVGAAAPDRVRAVVAPLVAAAGLDLEECELTSAGRRRVLRVVVDKDGGVSLDDIAVVSHELSERLDEKDPLGGQAYTLEVTSPGVDRPLTLPRHWRRATGRLVRAVLTDGGAVTGRVVDVTDDAVSLDVDGRPRELALSTVARASVEVEFRRLEAEPADDLDEDTDEPGREDA